MGSPRKVWGQIILTKGRAIKAESSEFLLRDGPLTQNFSFIKGRAIKARFSVAFFLRGWVGFWHETGALVG
jgi:hypothetical protein